MPGHKNHEGHWSDIRFVSIKALGQYYFWNRYAVALFGGFIAKTNRYAAAFLSQGRLSRKERSVRVVKIWQANQMYLMPNIF